MKHISKITPFQQALKNELSRLESIRCEHNTENSRILLVQPKFVQQLTSNKLSFLQLFRQRLNLRTSF